MISTWLHQQQQEQLIIFCNGWGMDATPFLPLSARDHDVIMLSDYQDLTLDFDPAPLFRRYQRTILVSWSMGVWVGQQIFQPWSHCLQGAIAINGTLCPIHDQFGIPVQLYGATLEQFSAASRLKFYRRMCGDRHTFDIFLGIQPQRSVESQRLELAALQRSVSCQPVGGRDLYKGRDRITTWWCPPSIRSLSGRDIISCRLQVLTFSFMAGRVGMSWWPRCYDQNERQQRRHGHDSQQG